MGWKPSEVRQQKVVVAGGFGVGKTTMVGSISEITPLHTEELLTEASSGVDDLTYTEQKSTTTAAMDFGRITLRQEGIQLMLFGTPGQDRFWFMWDDLCRGAVGAVVIVDTRRLDASFSAVSYFEARDTPFIVAVNDFPAAYQYSEEEVRDALAVPCHVPIVRFDAQRRQSTARVLKVLVQHAIELACVSA